MADSAAPREGEDRLHDPLETTVNAVARPNQSILGLSEVHSRVESWMSIQMGQPRHDGPAALSVDADAKSSFMRPSASRFDNNTMERASREPDVASQDTPGAATVPLTVDDSSSQRGTLDSDYGLSDADDVMLEFLTSTSEVGITTITGVDLKDNVGVILDLDQIPEVVCGLALQVVANATAKDKECSWLSARDACIRSACLSRRCKWHPTAQRLAACQTCSNTRNVCLGVDQDDQGRLTLRLRPLASQFRRGAALRDPKAWILPVDNDRRTLTRHRAWRQERL